MIAKDIIVEMLKMVRDDKRPNHPTDNELKEFVERIEKETSSLVLKKQG